jgi:medium-chain acyl-[acyl-carrier-protein] hydrolase
MPHLVEDLADALLADLADSADPRYAVYGHSLGALIGFELVHEIRRRGGPAPVRLVVSGAAAPQWTPPEPDPTETDLSDPQIIDLLRKLGGTPEIFLSDPRVLRMIMPPIRADLQVKSTYRYAPQPPLDLPITALASTEDLRAPQESMAAWREQTVRRFTLHTLTGGHFAVLEQSDTVLAHLAATL